MPYTIYTSDGQAVEVPDNDISTEFYNTTGGDGGNGLGVRLLGRNSVNYGASVAQNFLQMTENFCSANTPPSDTKSLQGQLWFKKSSTTTGDLYVRLTANGTPGGIANWSRLLSVDANGVVTLGDLPVFGVNNAVVASGTVQGDSTLLTKAINIVVTTPVNSGVRLPVAVAGYRIIVRNSGVNPLKVYPSTGAAIESAGVNVAITLPANSSLEFYCGTSAISGTGGQWYNLSSVYA